MAESKQQLNQRLHREGRYLAFRNRCEELVAEKGISFSEARAIATQEFQPLEETSLGLDDLPQGNAGETPDASQPATQTPEIPESEDSTPDAQPPRSPKVTEAEARELFCGDGTETYWDALKWAVDALGLKAAGIKPKVTSCPNPSAWAAFQFAERSPRDFFNLWASQGLKRGSSEEELEKQRRSAQRTIEDIETMLEEIAQLV